MQGDPPKRGLFFDSALLFLANGVGSLIGFSFHLAVARVGGPAVYGDLGALLSMGILFGVASMSVQIYVAARIARLHEAGVDTGDYLGQSVRRTIGASAVVSFILIAFSYQIARFLNLADVAGVWVLAMGLIFLVALSVFRGALQGTQKFVVLAITRMAEPSIQFAVGITLVAIGLGGAGAFSGTISAIAIVAAFCMIWLKVRPWKFTHTPLPDTGGGAKDMSRVAAFLIFANAFTNFDVLLVKHYFPADSAAQYVAASFMSRILLLSAMSIALALFPRTVVVSGREGRHMMAKSILYFMAFAVPFVAVCTLFNRQVVNLFYGDAYSRAARILPQMLLAYTGIGVGYLVGTYRLSRAHRYVWAPFAMATALQVILIWIFPFGLSSVAWYMLICSLMLTIGTIIPPKLARQ